MKPFLFIGLLGIGCIVALLVLHRAEGVSVEVLSCDADGRDAVIRIHHSNRLPSAVSLSYDVALTANGRESRFGGTGVRTIKIKHMTSVELKAGEEKDQIIRIAFPPKVITADAMILNVAREPVKSSSAKGRPNQTPEPTSPLVTIRACARLAPSGAVAHL